MPLGPPPPPPRAPPQQPEARRKKTSAEKRRVRGEAFRWREGTGVSKQRRTSAFWHSKKPDLLSFWRERFGISEGPEARGQVRRQLLQELLALEAEAAATTLLRPYLEGPEVVEPCTTSEALNRAADELEAEEAKPTPKLSTLQWLEAYGEACGGQSI